MSATPPESPITICLRQDADLTVCVQALAAVHVADQYPMRWPEDPAAWLAPARMLAAWIACDMTTGAVLGHVALCAAAGDDAQPWVVASRLPTARLAEVSRLFVALDARGLGIGARLLEMASQEARMRSLLPVLKVSSHDQSAVALYERQGWRHVASLTNPWEAVDPSRTQLQLHYYIEYIELGPEPV